MYGPFPAASVEARLSQQVGALRLVGNAADLETARKSSPAAVPAAFVLREESGDAPDGFTWGVLSQRVKASLIVVLWVRNYAAAAAGSGARGEMDALQLAVRQALIGWTSDADVFAPLSLHIERDIAFDGGSLVAQSIFRSDYTLRTGATA